MAAESQGGMKAPNSQEYQCHEGWVRGLATLVWLGTLGHTETLGNRILEELTWFIVG